MDMLDSFCSLQQFYFLCKRGQNLMAQHVEIKYVCSPVNKANKQGILSVLG